MFDQELREGERRKDGESFKKFLGRRLLVAAIVLGSITILVYLLFNAVP